MERMWSIKIRRNVKERYDNLYLKKFRSTLWRNLGFPKRSEVNTIIESLDDKLRILVATVVDINGKFIFGYLLF